MSGSIEIDVMRCRKVRVSPYLPSGGDGFALLFSDGGYAARSWKEMIRPGISMDPQRQMASLGWIRDQSPDPDCVESLADHDPDAVSHTIHL